MPFFIFLVIVKKFNVMYNKNKSNKEDESRV